MFDQSSYQDTIKTISEFPYISSNITISLCEEQEIEQSNFLGITYFSLYNEVFRFILDLQRVLSFVEKKQSTSTLNIQKEYYLFPIESFLEYKQERQKLEQLALYIIYKKLSKIENVKSIYVQRYREELQLFVLLLEDKYDFDLRDKLLDIEYEIRKMFPDIVFQFFYLPASISEKEDFIHPQAECIYMK